MLKKSVWKHNLISVPVISASFIIIVVMDSERQTNRRHDFRTAPRVYLLLKCFYFSTLCLSTTRGLNGGNRISRSSVRNVGMWMCGLLKVKESKLIVTWAT